MCIICSELGERVPRQSCEAEIFSRDRNESCVKMFPTSEWQLKMQAINDATLTMCYEPTNL